MGNLTDKDVINQIQKLAAEERKLTMQVLELLREVERRRLYAQQGFSSLFEFAVKSLGYSEASAARRINSMRLLKEIPDAASSIETGKLNLSHMSSVHSFLKREEKDKGKTYSTEEKRELLERMENRSSRECEKILFGMSPESARPEEKQRVISPGETEIRFIASDELVGKLEQLRGLLAHSHPELKMAQLVEILADRALDRLDPVRKEARIQAKARVRAEKAPFTPTPDHQHEASPTPEPKVSKPPNQATRRIPAQVRRQVWVRDGGKCTFISPTTGQRCESRFKFQVDHQVPVSMGGGSDINYFRQLRLLCHTHNTWEAMELLGREKMARFIPGLG